MKTYSKFFSWTLNSLIVISFFIFTFIVFKSTKLRPISDDYCFAAVAGQGVFGALTEWYLNWTGDLFGILLSTILIGSSIIHLPWSISSAIPFLTSGIAIGSISYLTYKKSIVSGGKSPLILTLSLPVIVANTWWSHWWISPRLNLNDQTLTLPNTITFWQTINTGYIISLVLILYLLFTLEFNTPRYSMSLSIFVGFILGLSGMVFAISILSLVFITMTLNLFRKTNKAKRYYSSRIILILTTLVFLSFAFFSPGTQSRKLLLEMNPQIENLSINSLLFWTFPEAITTWTDSVINIGTLLSFTTFIILGFISVRYFALSFEWKYRNWVAQLLLLSILILIISRISEAFAYPAFWHWVPIYVINFLIVIYISFYFGALLGKKYVDSRTFVTIVVLLAFVQVVQIYSIGFMASRIDQRYALWSKGSAPLYQIADLYFPPTRGYTDECWDRIGEYRKLPKRIS